MNCTLDPRRRQQQEGAGGALPHPFPAGGKQDFCTRGDRLQKREKKFFSIRNGVGGGVLVRPFSAGRQADQRTPPHKKTLLLLFFFATLAHERESMHGMMGGGRAHRPTTDHRAAHAPSHVSQAEGFFLGPLSPSFSHYSVSAAAAFSSSCLLSHLPPTQGALLNLPVAMDTSSYTAGNDAPLCMGGVKKTLNENLRR